MDAIEHSFWKSEREIFVVARSVAAEIEACGRPLSAVMAGLVPAIHVIRRTWMDVDARDKPGHDEQLIGTRLVAAIRYDS